MARQWKLRPHDTELEYQHLINGWEPLMARLLAQRGIGMQEADQFFAADLADIDLFKPLGGIDQAADLLLTAARRQNTSVGVIGDYDADGVTSSAMFQRICRALGLECQVFLPHRVQHGYGLNPKTVPAFCEFIQKPPRLLFILDCGTSSEAEVCQLREFGISQIVIIDHHIPESSRLSKSADILVNWRLCGGSEMCTAGEVLMLARALDRRTDKKHDFFNQLLPLAAIGTVADISPIARENRVIVRHGLAKVGESNYIGLRMLAEICNMIDGRLSQMDVSFGLAPRLNAAGRINSAYLSYNLMVEDKIGAAGSIVSELDMMNKERKHICNELTAQALEAAEKSNFTNGLLLINPEWNVGVVGIVASRIVDRFGIPTIVMGQTNGTIKGSGRSLGTTNIKAIMDSCAEMFSNYGGHEMACGAALKPEYVATAPKLFDEACRNYYAKHGVPIIDRFYDAALKPTTITVRLCDQLIETFYPYCDDNNPEPVFLLSNAKVVWSKPWRGDDWQLMTYELEKDGIRIPIKFKTFDEEFGSGLEGKTLDMYFSFTQSYGTKYGPELWIVDVIRKD